MTLSKKFVAAFAVGLVAGSAQALTCGGPSGTRTVTVNPAAACTTTGLGNLGDGAITSTLGSGSVMINRDAANSNGGALNITGVGQSSGGWSLTSSLWTTYSSLYLYFHFGNGSPTDLTNNPDWFIVQLTSGATSGTWSVNPTQLTLSNIAVVGFPGSSSTSTSSGTTSGNVPEPASATMVGLGLGLLGLGFAARRRRKA